MARVDMLKSLAGLIADGRRPHPVRDVIDGIDASGKTTLADVVVDTMTWTGRFCTSKAAPRNLVRPGTPPAWLLVRRLTASGDSVIFRIVAITLL